VATGTITIAMIRSAKGKTISLPKTLNYSTGKISNRQTGFNNVTWGKKTRAYVKGINDNLSDDMFEHIINHAKAAVDTSHHTANQTADTVDHDRGEEPDKRVQLKDRPCSDSDDDGQAEDEEEDEDREEEEDEWACKSCYISCSSTILTSLESACNAYPHIHICFRRAFPKRL